MRITRALLALVLLLGAVGAQEPGRPLARLRLAPRVPGPAARNDGAILRCGFPLLPEVEVLSLAGLRIETAAGKALPARLRVMTRRSAAPGDDKAPIDWVELVFAPGAEDGDLFLLQPGEPVAGDLRLRHDEDRLVIERGDERLCFDPAAPALLSRITIGETEALAAPALRPYLRDEKGELLPQGPWRLEVLAASDVAIDLAASCSLGDLLFELELRLVSGSDEFIVDQRLVNEGPYGHMGSPSEHRYFRSLDLSLPAPAGLIVLEDEAGRIDGPRSWALLQQQETPYRKDRPAESFPAQIWSAGELRRSLDRAEGLVALAGEPLTLACRVDDFWENAPGSLFLDQGEFFWGLFPQGGSGPHHRGRYGRPPTEGEVDQRSLAAYRFEGARAKSRRIVLSWRRAADGDLGRDRLRQRAARGLHLAPPPEDLAGRDLLGYRLVPRGTVAGGEAARFERFAAILVDDRAADHQDALGQIGLPAFIERGGTYGNRVFRGWFNHGDIAWGDGYSSLHYDLPFSVLVHYLRTGDGRFLALGEDMARHRRDIDQDHDRRSGFKLAGGQFYEKGYWHGNYYHPSVSHTWLRGPLLHWLLTGERWSLEAALLDRDFIRRAGLGAWNGDWGSRIPGWGADQLLALWELLHDPADLAAAEAALAAYEKVESGRDGGRGYVINRQMKPPSCQPWMTVILGCAAARHGVATGSERFRPLVDRIAAFLRDQALVDPAGPFPRLRRQWAPGLDDAPGEHHLAWGAAAFFAQRWRLGGRDEDRDLARRLFASAVLHQGEKAGGPVAFRLLAYPNSESKIQGMLQIWGLLALPALAD